MKSHPIKSIFLFVFLWWVSPQMAFGQKQLNIQVKTSQGLSITGAEIYAHNSKNNSYLFIGITNSSGEIARQILSSIDFYQIKCLGYRDTIIYDLTNQVITLTPLQIDLESFVLVANSSSVYNLVQTAFLKGALLNKNNENIYDVEIKEQIISLTNDSGLTSNSFGTIVENAYKAKRQKKNNMVQEQWNVPFLINRKVQNHADSIFEPDFFPLNFYWFVNFNHPNPFNTKTLLDDKKTYSNQDIARIISDSNFIVYDFTNRDFNRISTLQFSLDSVLLSSKYLANDTVKIPLPPKSNFKAAGWANVQSTRKWENAKDQYCLKSLTQTHYYFVIDNNSKIHEYIYSIQVKYNLKQNDEESTELVPVNFYPPTSSTP